MPSLFGELPFRTLHTIVVNGTDGGLEVASLARSALGGKSSFVWLKSCCAQLFSLAVARESYWAFSADFALVVVADFAIIALAASNRNSDNDDECDDSDSSGTDDYEFLLLLRVHRY